MSNFRGEKLNPLEVIKQQIGITCDHITYDPTLRKSKSQYQRIRQCSHDGTMIFTCELLADTLLDLINMRSYAKNFPPEEGKTVVGIKYTVGSLWLSTVWGTVELPAGTYPGQCQRTRMSVVCEYIYAEAPQPE
nr:MAG TPA: hypothetical protein [Caudoviricetes sp.]